MSKTTPPPRPRRSHASPKNTFTTKSGRTIKLNRSLSDRVKASKEAKARRKAAYLSTLPTEKWKRALYRLHPKRVLRYWFSREGAIMALKITGVGVVIVFLVIVGLFAYFRKDLPKIKDLSGAGLGGSVTYYDRSGSTVLWQDYNSSKRVPVDGSKISKYMKDATVAVEDKDFYKHGAFDVRGIVRAGVNDVKGGSTQGGSTITQQLVKLNENWVNDHTVSRKVKELILAVELEREYSKDDVLNGYLNIAPYGNVDNGVEAAAQDYFGVSADKLSLAQAATLASIPKSPYHYSPYSSPIYNKAISADNDGFYKAALLGREQYALNQMAKQGYITQAQADEAKKVDVLAQIKPLVSKYDNIKAPYFVQAAKQELTDRFGGKLVNLGGWKVITTLDSNLQNTAETLVQNNRANVSRLTHGLADEQATVTEDVQTGQIVALVGGVDFGDLDHGSINYASTYAISPGSSFKPYDYAAMIDNNTGVGAGSVIYDTQGAIPGYPCIDKSRPTSTGDNSKKCLYDYDFNFPGPITLRYALGGSRNIPAEKAMLSAVPNDTSAGKVNSINKTIDIASAMMDNPYLQQQNKKTYNCYAAGVDINTAKDSDITQCYNSAAIGDGAYLHLDDHVNGLATLARLGTAIPRTYLLSVTAANNKSLYKYAQPQGTQVLKADTAYIVNNMASDPKASYLPGSCTDTNCTKLNTFGYKFHRFNGWNFAIKTGTTNYGFDGLMASWSSKYAVVTWTGNHTRNVDISKYGAAMETLTEPVTRGMMEAAHTGLKPVNWVQPTDIKALPAFVIRSKVSRLGESVPSPSTDLFPSWYVSHASANTSQTLDKVSNKLATSCTPDLAKEITGNSNVNSWNVDIFNGGSTSGAASTTQTSSQGSDDVHVCGEAQPSIQITAVNGTAGNSGNCPANSSSVGCDIKVLVQQGAHALTDSAYPNYPGTINLLVNGQIADTKQISDGGTYDFTYKPDSSTSGTVQFSVQVIDSVLYTGNDNGTITLAAAPPGGHGGGNENPTPVVPPVVKPKKP